MRKTFFKKTLCIILSVIMLTSGASVFAQDTQTTKPIVPKYNTSTLKKDDYALFSIGEKLPLSIHSSIARINGNVYSSSDFVYDGAQLTLDGECNVAGKIIKKGSYAQISKPLENIVRLNIKNYIEEIKMLLSADCEKITGDKTYQDNTTILDKDIMINGNVNIISSILNGSSYLFAKNNININTSLIQTNKEKPFIIVSEEGSIEINSSCDEFNGIIYSPNGKVTINSNSFNLNGKIIAQEIVFKGSSITIKDNKDYFNRYITMMPTLTLVEDIDKTLKFKLSNCKEGYDYKLNYQFCEMTPEEIGSVNCNEIKEVQKGEFYGLYRYFVVAQAGEKTIKSNIINYVYTENFNGEIGEDYDGDYLGNEQEIKLGTDPYKVDTDGDTLYDGHEVYFYNSNPLLIDTDNDGLNDYQEVVILSYDPTKKDTDGNGVLDGDEDPDKDGVINIDEFKLNGNPLMDDSDFDGLKDGKEKELGTKLDNLDTDNDKLSDAKEIELGTDPLNPDTNGNGILDGDEIYSTIITADENDIDKRAVPTVDVKLKGEQIDSLKISKVDDDDSFLTKDIPGFIGCGYDFSVNGEFESAKLTYEFDKELLNQENFIPRVYYYDEEKQLLEELPNQIQNGNKVTVSLSHFSKYILVNKHMLDEVMKEEILAPIKDDFEQIPLDIAFVIDGSGSMPNNDPNNLRFDASKQVIKELGNEDRVAVIGFDNFGYLRSEFTYDKNKASKAIEQTYTAGGTSTYAGIIKALEQFEKQPKNAMKKMIVLTDGYDNYYFNYEPLLFKAKTNNIAIYTVGLGSVNTTLLKNIADSTGGKYYHASNAKELIDEFKKIKTEIDIYKDTDRDGLSDYHEHNLRLGNGVKIKTDVNKADTDGDGLLDGEEIELVLKDVVKPKPEDNILLDENTLQAKPNNKTLWYVTLKSNPNNKDSDSDGYTDFEEKQNGTNLLVWDVSDRHLALFAHVSYSTANIDELNEYDEKEFLNKASTKELKGWKIAFSKVIYNKKNEEIDFAANVYMLNKQIVVAYRGTSDNIDWYENIMIYPNLFYPHPQSIKAQKFMESVLSKIGVSDDYKIYITGHSLGGLLALNGTYKISTTKYNNLFERAATFNGLGLDVFSKKTIKKELEKVNNKIGNYIIQGLGAYPNDYDVVSQLGDHYGKNYSYKVTLTCLKAEGLQNLKPHQGFKILTKYINAKHRLVNFYEYGDLKYNRFRGLS